MWQKPVKCEVVVEPDSMRYTAVSEVPAASDILTVYLDL